MKHIYTSILLLLFVFNGYAQLSGAITGEVRDEQGKAINAATVSLLRSADSALVKAAITNKDGQFDFPSVKPGSYLVSFSAVGFKKQFSSPFQYEGGNHSLAAAKLSQRTNDLGAVTVTAQKPFVETKLDKTVVNVEASPTNAGATALDVLEKSPGIMVNGDGAINLRGKQGVVILMDGKQVFLSPTDLAALLRNMPASALDQIEIMTNPSSKYDATGNSGIINIKTKKGRNAGFNGSVMVGATSSIYRLDGETLFIPKSQNSINFNYKKGSINFFGNYNPNFFRGRNTMRFESKIMKADRQVIGYNNTDTRFQFGNNNHTLKLGLDWTANKKNTFGIMVSGFAFMGHPTPTTEANIYNAGRRLTGRLVSMTDNEIDFKNFTGNLNWKHSFDSTGKELTADFDYVTYSNVADMVLTTDYYNGQLDPLGRTWLKGHLPAAIDIYTLKSDYTLPVRGGRFEAGFKVSYVVNDNLVDYSNSLDNSKWTKDTIRSNNFIYKENINAAYVNYNRQIKKWTLQAGLRMENTIANGRQVVRDTRFKRNMTDFFPTAFISYAANASHTMTVNYGRRIQRPNYQDLNPFIFFLDTLSYRQGNIYLRPQYAHNIELSHAFKGKFITSLNYTRTNDVISQNITAKSDTSFIRFLTVDNVSSLRNIGISVTAPFTVAKWWNLNVFANGFENNYRGRFDTFNIDVTVRTFMLNITNNFTLGKGYSAELSGFYRSRSLFNLSVMDPQYQMSFGFQKQVAKGKGTVRLNVRDPFAWQVFTGYNRYGIIDNNFSFRPDIRQVTATFTWRFGSNGQNAPAPRRRNSSSQDEQNRAGQGNQ